jgi:hypothetical protein
MQHRVLGDDSTSGNLQSAGLFAGRIVRRVAESAHFRCVSGEYQPVRSTRNESLGSRVGECDVCKAGKEHDPPVQEFKAMSV